MTNRIDLTNCKGYATEANLVKGLERLGLDDYEGCRYVVARTADGKWTAIFLVGEWLRTHGGYIAFASQHGFMSI